MAGAAVVGGTGAGMEAVGTAMAGTCAFTRTSSCVAPTHRCAIIAALAVHDWTTCWRRRIATRGCHVRNQRAPRAITPVSRVSMAIDVPAVGKRGPPVDAATFATHGTSGALPPARDGTKG